MRQTDSLKVAMFSAEAVPFAKVGGLADVVGVLPRFLEKIGAAQTVIIPAYKSIDRDRHRIRRANDLADFEAPLGAHRIPVEVSHTRLPETNVDVYFVAGGHFFSRDGIYDDPATREAYPDNMQRFVFLARAGLELLRRKGSAPDVIHCHDSHTALIPGLLRTVYATDPFFTHTGALFTIHNLAYQSLFPKDALDLAGIDPGLFHTGSPFEYWGRVNFMKVGIETADLINTVSEGYAREIQADPKYGFGLEGVLQRRSADLSGIVNGIDYSEWNPETDPFIAARYSAHDLAGKEECKRALLEIFGLPAPPGRMPLIGIISRLADQKGFDLIGAAIDEMGGMELQMVVLGTGQQKYHDLFQKISMRYPDRFAVRFEFNNALAHQIEAGADMFLMPSRYEPCGLNQLFSLRYGTVPIVRATGGLADTVINYDIAGDRGTGFSFTEYGAPQMMLAVRRALMVYSDPVSWRDLMLRGMAEDWSWEASAQKYMRLYERIRIRKRR